MPDYNGYNSFTRVGPGDRMIYCFGCDGRFAESMMFSCDEDMDWFCRSCVAAHVHNGGECSDCGFRMLRGAMTESCDHCGVTACSDHMRQNHRGCEMGGYDSRDDGRFSGRPPIEGYGREASLHLLDAEYIPHPLALGKRAAAVELEVEYDGETNNGRVNLPDSVGVGGDGSLSNGIEVTTPPTRGHLLADVILDTTRILAANGYTGKETCGMHTHIDLRDKVEDKRFLSHLFNAFFSIEDILYAMQAEKRYANTYSVPLRNTYKFFDMYGQKSGDFDYTFYRMPKNYESHRVIEREKTQKYGSPRYAAFNFHSVYYRGSLECRLHEGTVNGEDALMWIDLLQSIIARVEDGHSYSVMKNLVKQKVTKKKVRAFARYFRLTDDQLEFVMRRIESGQGFGFTMPESFRWGVPIKGRPTREPSAPARRRLLYTNNMVTCHACSHSWMLMAHHNECPRCWGPLVDRYNNRNYNRVSTESAAYFNSFATLNTLNITGA